MSPAAIILFLPSTTALLFIEMSYMLSPCIKYYRSTPWGENTPALLKQKNLYFSPSFRTSVLTGVSGWSVRVQRARTLEGVVFPTRLYQQSEKKAVLALICCQQQTLSKNSPDSSIWRPTSQGFCPGLFLVYSSLLFWVIKDHLTLVCDGRGSEQLGRCWIVPCGPLAWHSWWKTAVALWVAAAPASPPASEVRRDSIAQLSGDELGSGKKSGAAGLHKDEPTVLTLPFLNSGRRVTQSQS